MWVHYYQHCPRTFNSRVGLRMNVEEERVLNSKGMLKGCPEFKVIYSEIVIPSELSHALCCLQEDAVPDGLPKTGHRDVLGVLVLFSFKLFLCYWTPTIPHELLLDLWDCQPLVTSM